MNNWNSEDQARVDDYRWGIVSIDEQQAASSWVAKGWMEDGRGSGKVLGVSAPSLCVSTSVSRWSVALAGGLRTHADNSRLLLATSQIGLD